MKSSEFAPVAALFVISGSISTIGTKWQDLLRVADSSGQLKSFEHPFVQSWVMFLGEFLCIFAFMFQLHRTKKREGRLVSGVDYALPCGRWVFFIPSLLDFTSSTLGFIGLTLTYASVYGMLRGSTIIFTGVLSRIFLKRKFQLFHWLGMLLVVCGLVLVGLSSVIEKKTGAEENAASNPLLGNTLIVGAQLIVGIHVTFEEHVIGKYQIQPFEMVGWEGMFGLGFASLALGAFQFWGGKPDDVLEAGVQMSNSWRAVVSVLVVLCAVPVYNAMAVTLTKRISSTARMVLDTLRNIVVWIFAMAYSSFFGESFSWLQLSGFVLIVGGNSIFRGLLVVPIKALRPAEHSHTDSGDDLSPPPGLLAGESDREKFGFVHRRHTAAAKEEKDAAVEHLVHEDYHTIDVDEGASGRIRVDTELTE